MVCFVTNPVRPLLQSNECKAFYVVLKFLNHLFNSFGRIDWLYFIPKKEDRLEFGSDLQTAKTPSLDGIPLLKLDSRMHFKSK